LDLPFKAKRFYELFKRGNFTIRYIVGLSIIAFLSIALHSIVQYNLYFQRKGIDTLQKAREHNQMALVLRKELFLLQSISSEEKVKSSLKEFNKKFNQFSKEAVELWVAEESDSIKKAFKSEKDHEHWGITEIFYYVTESVKELNQLSTNDPSQRTELILKSADSLKKYRELSDIELDVYDKEYSSNLERFRYYEIFILIITLLTLILEALFIFRPAMKKLEEAQRARSDFFSRIGHEIRNPMNSILGMTTLLERQYQTRTQKTYLFRLKKSAEGLLSFLNNVIEHSGLEHGKTTVSSDKVIVKELIEEIASLFYFDAGKKGLEFYVSITEDFPEEVETDYVKLKYIIINLLGNAIKFTSDGHIKLSLSFSPEKKILNITISDTGIGIEKEKIDSIFESFIQADSSVKRKFGGTGLGLSIVREYVDLLRGSIRLESEKNVGSSFFVDIPIVDYKNLCEYSLPDFNDIYVQESKELKNWIRENLPKNKEFFTFSKLEDLKDKELKEFDAIFLQSRIKTPEILSIKKANIFLMNISLNQKGELPSNLHSVYPGITWNIHSDQKISKHSFSKSDHLDNTPILICDDIEDNRYILKAHLEQHFSNLSFAKDGKECLELLKDRSFKAVFLDIQMPEIDGFSVISNANTKDINFIAFTAHNSAFEREKMLRAGFREILEKPINENQLNEVLKKLLPRIQKASSTPTSFEEKIRLRLLKKKPQFIEDKLKQINDFENGELEAKTFGHQLKGSASNYGLDILSRLGKKIEESNDPEVIKELIFEVKEILVKEKATT
tara:strand:+ start:138257 stop:140620 length:2364 start_codon:yes stop_codon:yes gene_type:complete